jgi:hypothetical protein
LRSGNDVVEIIIKAVRRGGGARSTAVLGYGSGRTTSFVWWRERSATSCT